MASSLGSTPSPTNAITATATAGAATVNSKIGKVTSESLTTIGGAYYTLTITNSSALASSVVIASVDNGTNTTDTISVERVRPSSNSIVIRIKNTGASALNGTLLISFVIL